MKNLWRAVASSLLFFTLFFHLSVGMAQAQGSVLGIHILSPWELSDATELLKSDTNTDDWHYVTIPVGLDDLDKAAEWQAFFNQAREHKVIPIVRLTTRIENEAWKVPNRQEIVALVGFLSRLEWPTSERHIIVFNEVNHAKEWGGSIDPEEYARVLEFTSNWARSEQKNYVVMPAAMDLAAPNGRETMEAFNYLNKMASANPDIFKTVDVWNSHSYPNPAFSAAPTKNGQNSLRGFEYELKYLKDKTGQDYKVFITETGWVVNRQTQRKLDGYYAYAMKNIWSNPQVVAVTPFLLRGAPGPFEGFTFLDQNSQPTLQYQALQKALSLLNS